MLDDPAEAPKGSTCVSELEGAELDAAVARALGWEREGERWMRTVMMDGEVFRHPVFSIERWRPSSEWDSGGPIIDRERIATWWEKDCWNAAFGLQLDVRSAEHSVVWMNCRHLSIGPTPLIAAMRAFVAMNTQPSRNGSEPDRTKE